MVGKHKAANPHDPRGLIADALELEGLSIAEYRSIFLDWALGTEIDSDIRLLARELHAQYVVEHPDHPIVELLANCRDELSPGYRRRGRFSSRRK